MQVSGEVTGRGEDTLMILPVTLTIELFPPFREVMQPRLIIDQNLDKLPPAVENVPGGCIPVSRILLEIRVLKLLITVPGTVHDLLNIDAASGDRQ